MALPTLLAKVVEALRSAGATEEIIAAAVKAAGEFGEPSRSKGGRPRKHFADRAATPIERVQASRARQKSGPCFETSGPGFETVEAPPDVLRNEFRNEHLQRRLLDAGHGNFDLSSDLAPIRAHDVEVATGLRIAEVWRRYDGPAQIGGIAELRGRMQARWGA